MRKILLFVIISTFLFSCKTEPKVETAKTEEGTAGVTASNKKPATEILDMSAADFVKRSF